MATPTPQEAAILTPALALAFVARHGIVTEAARHAPFPSLVDAIAGEPVRGNWWSHPRARIIFAATRAVRAAPNVLVCRLVAGRITFVHDALWPALARAAAGGSAAGLARVHEVHTAQGRHAIEETPFPDWMPRALPAAGAHDAAAVARIRALLRGCAGMGRT